MNHQTVSAIAKSMVPLIGEPIARLRNEHTGSMAIMQQRLDAVVTRYDAQLQEMTSQVGALILRISELEQRAPVPGPQGESGVNGKDGAPGLDGKDGAPGLAGLQGEIGPAGKRGEKGEPGERGESGKPGEPGAVGQAGINGKDGIGLAGALIDRDGNLVVTSTDGNTKTLGLVVGRDGAPGQPGINGKDGINGINGKNGFALEHFDTEMLPDGKTVLFKFKSGDVEEIHELFFPIVVDKGVWSPGPYLKGDAVTFAGSLFIAQEDTTEKPETGKGWRLAVKRGRDGKPGKDGK
jgi:hypothetical protein